MLSRKVAKGAQTATDSSPLQWDDTRLAPYIGSISTPSDETQKQLMVLLGLNRNFRDGTREIFRNDAWAKWRADTTKCLEITVPGMIAEGNMEIVTVLVGYTDRPNIQAEILSMIWERVGMDDSVYGTFMAAAVEKHKIKFTDLMCRVLTLAERISPKQIQSYMNVGLMLEHILKHNVSSTILDDLTTADVDENKPTVFHTVFRIVDTSFCILEKIYQLQHARAQEGNSSVKMEDDASTADVVQIENDVQTVCTKLISAAQHKLVEFNMSTAVNYKVVTRNLVQRHMPQMLGFSRLTRYSGNFIKTNQQMMAITYYFYRHVFRKHPNPTGTHEYLDSFLQEAEEIILDRLYKEEYSHTELRKYHDNFRYDDPNVSTLFDMHTFRGDFDIAQAQMARRLVPFLTTYFHCFPIYRKSHERIIRFLSKLNTTGSATPPDIQHSILTGLVEKVYGKDVIDVLVEGNHIRRKISLECFPGDGINHVLQVLISNSLDMNTEQNSTDLSRLMQTRIFDIFVMKLHTWLDNPYRRREELTVDFAFLVQLLTLRRNPPARGFIFARVKRTSRIPRSIAEKTLHMDVPDGENTTDISEPLKSEILAMLTPPNSTVVEFQVERVTISKLLQQIKELPWITDVQRELWWIIFNNTR